MGGDVEAEAVRALAAASATIDNLEAALARIDEGRYDICETCGAQIEPAARGADPTALRCARHQKAVPEARSSPR